MRLNKLRKQMKILNWASDGFLPKRAEAFPESLKVCLKSLIKGRHVAASPESWCKTSVL